MESMSASRSNCTNAKLIRELRSHPGVLVAVPVKNLGVLDLINFRGWPDLMGVSKDTGTFSLRRVFQGWKSLAGLALLDGHRQGGVDGSVWNTKGEDEKM